MCYIETKFYSNGAAEARYNQYEPEYHDTDRYDYYVDEIDSLDNWIENNLEIEYYDIVELVLALEMGDWVDITPYI